MEYPSTLTIPTFDTGILDGSIDQPKQDIYTTNATQQHALGTKLVYPDGRVFRYAKNGAVALAKALMTSSAAITSYCSTIAQAVSGTSITAGLEEFEFDVTTGGTWVEDEFAEGFLVINKVTGIGDIYKVAANRINSGSDILMRVRLETPIRTTLAATSEITMVKSPWRDVIVMPTTAEGTPAGVPLVAVPINYYCWLQTGGYTPMVVDTSETLVKGDRCGYPGTPNVAGAVGDIETDIDAVWGIAVYVATEAEVAIVDLKLDS